MVMCWSVSKKQSMKQLSKFTYDTTIRSCMTGYVVQAIVNSFLPLLFLTLQRQYGISLLKISFLITFNFGLQLVIDLASAFFVDRIGYRPALLLAHGAAALGLVLLTILPDVFADPYVGLVIAVLVYAVGGGLLEVLVSPVVEACPSDHKASTMSMLHAAYCWGVVAVILVSTIFFAVFGIAHWKVMTLLWTIVPLANFVMFTLVPIPVMTGTEGGAEATSKKTLLGSGMFWLLFVMMLCAGASEQAVSQWASAFAESGLGITKTMGDLAGPMMFAVLMGTSRTIYGKFGPKIDLMKFMGLSVVLCVIGYLIVGFSPWPVLSLIGCGLCGFSVGIFWPGTFSLSAKAFPAGGTLMFSLLALGGDIGCAGGPTLVGTIASRAGDSLTAGFTAALLFPVLMAAGIVLYQKHQRNTV